MFKLYHQIVSFRPLPWIKGGLVFRSSPLRSTEKELAHMAEFIQGHCAAELNMWKPRTLQIWWSHNQFWVWIVTVLTGIIGIFIAAKAGKLF